MLNSTRRLLVAMLAGTIAAPKGALAQNESLAQLLGGATVPSPIEGQMPSFGGATAWLNSPPLTASDLRGHVPLHRGNTGPASPRS